MAGVLVKTRVLLDLHSRTGNEAFFYTAEPGFHDIDVTLDAAVHSDLGEPSQITVTIEPGDKLNEEGE